MHELLNALLLGILEGLTEFLPVSSTGHLIVAEEALGFRDIQDVFTIVIQLGAIAAVVWFFRNDLLAKTQALFKRQAGAFHFWKLLLIGTIPAGLVGLALDKSMEHITTPTVVASALILGGIVLWLVDNKPVDAAHEQHIDFRQISVKRALAVGLGQSIAIIPGVSRSGATIVTGLAAGLNRPTATAFSFYLSIPVLVLASGLKIVKHPEALSSIPGGSPALLVGIAASFVTALLSVSWLLHYVSRHNFRPFAYYRIALGAIILILVSQGIL